MSLKPKRSVLSIKDKNEDGDDIVYRFLNLISFARFCSSLIFIFSIIRTLDYLHYSVVPTSPDNRGSTVIIIIIIIDIIRALISKEPITNEKLSASLMFLQCHKKILRAS